MDFANWFVSRGRFGVLAMPGSMPEPAADDKASDLESPHYPGDTRLVTPANTRESGWQSPGAIRSGRH